MNKALKSALIITVIAVLSLLIGFAVQLFSDKLDRAGHPLKYTEYVERYAEQYKVPPVICYAVIKTESGFDSSAKSAAGAIGLMQLMPETFEYLCSLSGDEYETGMLYDPETNIRFGIYYLSRLYDRFGVWDTVFAAYNCGPTRVDTWIREGKADEGGRLTEIPIEETKNYVRRVNAAIEKYKNLYFNGDVNE